MRELDRQAGKRRFDALALVTGHHDHRPRPRTKRLLSGNAHQRPAADLGQEFVGAAHAARAAGGQHQSRDIASRLQRLVARLRPRHDLHEQAADAHAGDVLARHR